MFFVWHSLILVKTRPSVLLQLLLLVLLQKKSMASLENKPPVCFSAADTPLIHSYIKP